jgi:hypothetical protein
MPFIGPSKRIGPDLDTEWGTYTSPIFTAPADAKGRGIHFLPNDIRGRHQFRVQPRNLSMIPDDPAWAQPGLQSMLERTRSSLVPENTEAFGAAPTAAECQQACGMLEYQPAGVQEVVRRECGCGSTSWLWLLAAGAAAYLIWRR